MLSLAFVTIDVEVLSLSFETIDFEVISFSVEWALKMTFTFKVTMELEDTAFKSRYLVVPKSASFVDSTFKRFPSTETSNICLLVMT